MKTLLLLISILSLALSQDNLMPMSKCLHNCALCANNEPASCSGQEFVQCVKGYAGDRCQLRPNYAKEVVLMGGANVKPDAKGWEDQTVMKCGFRNSKMEMSPVYLLGLYRGETVNQVQIEIQPYFQNFILYFNLIRDSWTPYSDLMRIAVLDQQDNILAQHYIEFTQRQEIHPKKQLFRCNNDPLISQKYQIEGPLNPEVHQKLIIKWEGMLYSESVWGLTNVRVVFGCARGLVQGGMGCAGCGDGYWIVRDKEENVLGCEVCPVGCRACISAAQCTSCEEGLILSSGKCTNKYLTLTLPTLTKSLTCSNTPYQLSTPSQSPKSQTLTLQYPSLPAHKKFRILFNLAYHSAALSSGSTIDVSINGMKQKGFGKDLARPLRDSPKYLCQGFGDGYFELFKYVSGYFQGKGSKVMVQLVGRKGDVFGVSELQFQYEEEEIPKKEEPKMPPKQQKPVMPSPIIPKKDQKLIQNPKKEEQKPKQPQMSEQKPKQASKSVEKPIQAPKIEEKPKQLPRKEQKLIQTPKQVPKTEQKPTEPPKSEQKPQQPFSRNNQKPQQPASNQNSPAKEPEKPVEPVKQEKKTDSEGQKVEEIKERPAKNSQNNANEGQKVQKQPVKEEGKKPEPIPMPKQNSPPAKDAKQPARSQSKVQPQPQPTIPSPPSSKIPQSDPLIFPIPSSPSQIAQSIQKLQKNKWNIKIGLKTGKNLILCLFYPIELQHFPYFTAILQSKNLTIIPQVIDKNKQEQQLHFDLNFSLVSQTIDIYMQERPPSLMGRHLQTSPSPSPAPTNLLSSTYIKRYDHIPESTWHMIEQFATFFTIIAWTTILGTIVLAFLGYSVVMQKFSLGLQLAFLHVYVFTEYLPGNFKGIVGGLQRMENLDYLQAGLAGQIQGWLLGNVVQYSPPKFTTFNTDINFTRAVYPCLIINIAYILWFLALKLIKSRIEPCHQPSTPTEQSHQPLDIKLKLFLLRLGQRSLSFWHQILQYQYLTLFWSACLQFHNIAYPPDSSRSHIPNLIFCITVLALLILAPVLLMFYLQRVYGRMDYFQYGYWFQGVFWMGLPEDRLPGSQHRIDVLVRNFRYQLLVVFFAFLGDYPIQCLVLSITIHTLYLLYQKLSTLQPHPLNFLFTLLEHILLISLGIGLLVAYAISDKVDTAGYMVLGIVLVVLVLLVVVNGVARVCYGVFWAWGWGRVGKERSSVSQDDKEDKEVIN